MNFTLPLFYSNIYYRQSVRTEEIHEEDGVDRTLSFGLESVLKKEIRDMGYEISQVEDGRVTFYGGIDAMCRANVF